MTLNDELSEKTQKLIDNIPTDKYKFYYCLVRLICKTITGMTALILGVPAVNSWIDFFF